MTPKCYGCYKPVDQPGFHPKCAKQIFGTTHVPSLEPSERELEKYARIFIKERLAITGVQRKISLHLDAKDNTRFTIVGALGGNYILKPPSNEFSQLPELEDLTMHLAQAVGLQVAIHTLIPMADQQLAYITKRFDRQGAQKIAQEDACQLGEMLTENKYRSSHERLAKIIKRYSSFPGDDLLRLFELTLFSFLTGNADMHLKNFSLLKNAKGHYRLSPAYDLVPTRLLLSESEDPEELALHLSGKKSHLKRFDFLKYASYLEIPEKVQQATFDRFEKRLPKMLDWIERSFLTEDRKQAYRQLIATRWHRVADGPPIGSSG
jgi:serine/threonine-protein kinase HipA